MAQWELFRDHLRDLYLVQKMTLSDIKKHMEEHFNFQATDWQYEAQFREWGFRKNLKGNDWKYVHTRSEQRKVDGRGPSAVFHNGILISQKKVKKEIKRHVPLSYQYAPGPIPQSPGDVTVCTPPSSTEVSLANDANRLIPTKRKHLEGSLQDSSRSKRQYTVPEEAEAILDIATVPFTIQQSSLVAGCQMRPCVINLDGLPYFQFQDFMRSSAVVDGFRTLMNAQDGLVENFWPLPTTTYSCSQMLLADTYEPNLYLDDSLNSLMPYSPTQSSPVKLYKSFGTDILYSGTYLDRDVDQLLINTKTRLPKFLANIPQRKEGDLEANIDLLLGPPTIEAARYFVEIGVYLSSNNFYLQQNLIDWMIRIIPWSVLGPLLSNKLPTIQAFTEKVLDTAVRIGNIPIVRSLLESPILRAHVQSSGLPLIEAVKSSNAEMVSLLLKAGTHLNKGYFRETLLPVAQTVDIVQILVEAHADVNTESISDSYYGPALLHAVERGDVAVARYLISAGASVNVTGYDASNSSRIITPLAVATYGGQIELLRLLIKEGADVNAVSWMRRQERHVTALQLAAELDYHEIVTVLLEAGADSNFPACTRNGQTALQAAIVRGNIEMVELLLASGAAVNARSTNNIEFPSSPLLTAVEMNNVGLVEVLLAAGADVNTPAFGYFGSTLLEAAKAQVNCTRVVEILQKAGARETPVANDRHRRIQLRDAAWKGDLGRVAALIEIGVPINMEIIEDETPPYTDGGTILHWALNHRRGVVNVELFQLLVSNVKDINAQNGNSDLKPILHRAIEMRNIKLIEILMEAGADINVKNRKCATPLIWAAYGDDLDMVLFLLNKGADIDMVIEDACYNYPGLGATALKTSLSLRDCIYPRASLSLRATYNDFQIFHLLLDRGAAINAPITGSADFTELVYAIKTGKRKVVECLLRRGADVNTPPATHDGRTALQAAIELDDANLGMVRLLLENGADINGPPANICGKTALQAAAGLMYGNLDLVRLLLENGADINGPPAVVLGKTALQAAAQWGHFQIALLFLEAGADVNASSIYYSAECRTECRTALYFAANEGRLDLVHLLLEAGADKHLPLEERYTSAAEAARKYGHIVVVELLETWKRNEEIQSVKGHSASTSKDTRSVIELD